jgi:hypothetical protein
MSKSLPKHTQAFNKIYHFMVDNGFKFKMNSFEKEVYFFELNGITCLIYKWDKHYHISLTCDYKETKISSEAYLGALNESMIKHINKFKNTIKQFTSI